MGNESDFRKQWYCVRYFTKALNVITVSFVKHFVSAENKLQQIHGTLSTTEFQREAFENASTNTKVLNTMGYAAKALKKAHQQLYVF